MTWCLFGMLAAGAVAVFVAIFLLVWIARIVEAVSWLRKEFSELDREGDREWRQVWDKVNSRSVSAYDIWSRYADKSSVDDLRNRCKFLEEELGLERMSPGTYLYPSGRHMCAEPKPTIATRLEALEKKSQPRRKKS